MSMKYEDNQRTTEFQRNESLEVFLSDLNAQLSCSEENALAKYSYNAQEYPLIFIMGPHRSGSTLFLQWLANTGLFSYPTNLMSRFYGTPVIGAQIQMLLTSPRFNFRNEILDFNCDVKFESENGKTRGALSPNEFWFFWRKFLPFEGLDWASNNELHRMVDKKRFVAELTTLTKVFEKPFALKGMILNYNISFLDSLFENVLFVQLKRDPVSNVASILDARRRQLGDEKQWYSFKIPEYEQLQGLDAITQSAGQLYYINKAVDKGMNEVDESRKLVINYEDFCSNPKRVFLDIQERLGYEPPIYRGPNSFTRTRKVINGRLEIEQAINLFRRSE